VVTKPIRAFRKVEVLASRFDGTAASIAGIHLDFTVYERLGGFIGTKSGTYEIHPGDWVVKDGCNAFVKTDEEFQREYQIWREAAR
jgi:hypothetical protein